MTWQFFLLISILLSSFKGLLYRTLMKDEQSDARAQTIVFELLVGVIALIIALPRGFHLPQLPLLLPNLLLMIILLTLAPVFLFRSLQLSEVSQVSIVLSTQSFWTMIASFIFLGEMATFGKILGAVLIMVGMGTVLWKKQQIEISRGMFFALMSAFLYGISYVNAFFILQSLDAPSFQVYASLLPALVLLLLQPKTVGKMKFYLVPRNGLNVLLSAAFDTLTTIALYVAYQVGRNASQIAPLSQTSLILTVILAAFILKEKERMVNKIVGAVLAIAGSALIVQR